MKFILSISLAFLLISCENGQNVSPPMEFDNKISTEAEMDTNLVVPVNDDRTIWQKPYKVINALGDISGESVADIGAATGYFAFRFATKADKVIALDIDPKMLEMMDMIKIKSSKSFQEKLETRMASVNDPNLAEDEVDNIAIINTIVEIGNRKNYLQGLKKGLKKGGKLMIVDYKMKRLAIDAPDLSDRLPQYEVENLMEDAGYRIIKSDEFTLDYQYIVVGQYD